ncbi:hypothetical protein D3C76_486730 [compost metagenome]
MFACGPYCDRFYVAYYPVLTNKNDGIKIIAAVAHQLQLMLYLLRCHSVHIGQHLCIIGQAATHGLKQGVHGPRHAVSIGEIQMERCLYQ